MPCKDFSLFCGNMGSPSGNVILQLGYIFCEATITVKIQSGRWSEIRRICKMYLCPKGNKGLKTKMWCCLKL